MNKSIEEIATILHSEECSCVIYNRDAVTLGHHSTKFHTHVAPPFRRELQIADGEYLVFRKRHHPLFYDFCSYYV